MGFPAGMQLATIAFGIPLTVTGKDVVAKVTVKPTSRVIWAATGQPLPEFSDSFTAAAGQLGQFQVPFVNQAGFIDSTGAAVTDFAYQVSVSWEFGNERPITSAKNLKPLVGQTGTIDLDLVPDGPVSVPVTAPTAAVLGFGGRTGFVTLQESDLPQRLSVADLSATYGALFATGTEYNEDFSKFPDGSFAKASTGQAYSHHFTTADRELKVVGGFATYAATADLGGYASVLLDKDVEWLGGYFKFTSWSTGGGSVVFAATEEDIKATINAGQGIPRMAAHLTISPENVSVDVCLTKGTSVTNVFNLVFSTALAADDATIHSAWLAIDKKRGQAYLIDPNGNVHKLTHAGFNIPAKWMFSEVFRSATATGKTLGKIAKAQADSRDSGRLPLVIALHKASPKAVAVENMPGVQSDMTLTTTAAKVAGTDTTYTVPASGTVVVTLEALVDVTAAGPVHFGIFDSGNALISVRTVATKPVNGRLSLRLPLTHGTPGQTKTISMCAYLGGTAAAQILLGNYGTPNIYAGASVFVVAT